MRFKSYDELGREISRLVKMMDNEGQLMPRRAEAQAIWSPVARRCLTIIPLGQGWTIDSEHDQPYGTNAPAKYRHQRHVGVDINRGGGNQDYGAPFYAVLDAVVTYVGGNRSWGHVIVIYCAAIQHYFRYAHASRVLVVAGQAVERGQHLGDIGGGDDGVGDWGGVKGMTTFEAHLHLEACKTDRLKHQPLVWDGTNPASIGRHYTDPRALYL